jgi:hypothetical protein
MLKEYPVIYIIKKYLKILTMPVNYGLGKIYKIWSYQTDKIYVGSTCQRLSNRMSGHRRHYRRYQNGKYPFVTSFEILKFDDAKIELIELVNATCRAEILAREGHYIRTLDCVNKRIAGRDQKQYREDNKAKRVEYDQRPDNKAKRAEYGRRPEVKAKRSQQVQCECGCSISRGYISTHKKSAKHKRLLQAKQQN